MAQHSRKIKKHFQNFLNFHTFFLINVNNLNIPNIDLQALTNPMSSNKTSDSYTPKSPQSPSYRYTTLTRINNFPTPSAPCTTSFLDLGCRYRHSSPPPHDSPPEYKYPDNKNESCHPPRHTGKQGSQDPHPHTLS